MASNRNDFYALRLRDGIEANAWNWKNCTMFVQDLKSPGTNCAAEISKAEANNFIRMCNIFASSRSHEQLIDDYMMKLSQMRTAATIEPTFDIAGARSSPNAHELSPASLNALQNLKSSVNSVPASNSSRSATIRSKPQSISSTHPVHSLQFTKMIDTKKVSQAIPAAAADLANRTVQRSLAEIQIETILLRHLKEFDPTLEMVTFGSATYGLGGSHTNFNILAGDKKNNNSALNSNDCTNIFFPSVCQVVPR